MEITRRTLGTSMEVERSRDADNAIVVDIQRFSLHDGPGIRTTVFFKGCVLRCAWCQNPESLRRAPEMAFYRERCAGERRCAAVCPQGAILAGTEQRIDFTKCDACGRCAEACHHDALRLIGRPIEATELVHEILKDRDFFAESGGGVTLSGGEPMMHAGYLRRLLPLLDAHGLHIAMQTCGMFAWERMEPLLPYLDLILFDLKHMDSATHEQLTGARNEPILENFARLARSGVRLEARMPVIPGLNDGPENVRALARFLAHHGHATLHCLAYHDFGEAKLPRLAPIRLPLGTRSLDPRGLEPIVRSFEEEGINAAPCD